MPTVKEIIASLSHRPWPLPAGPWRFYQEWNEALFLHWEVSPALLRGLIPAGLEIDLFGESTWVSVVAFKMEQMRPWGLPALKAISQFREINLRAYVKKDDKPGVYFLSIEASKPLSALLARTISGLPYYPSVMAGTQGSWESANEERDFRFECKYEALSQLPAKTPLDHWLTERYCLYMEKEGSIYRYDTHHLPWELRGARLRKLDLSYRIGELALGKAAPDLVHYSPGVQVLAWGRKQV